MSTTDDPRAGTGRPTAEPVDEPRGPGRIRRLGIGGSDVPILGAVAVAATAIYGQVVTSTYAIADDATLLFDARRDNTTILDVNVGGGRVLNGIVQQAAMELSTDISSLRWLRLLGVIGLTLVAVVIALAARRVGCGRVAATAMAVIALAMPASQFIGSWAIMFVTTWSALAGLAAGLLLRRPAPSSGWSSGWTSGWTSWLPSLPALAVLSAALAVYQPGAMAYFAGGLIVAVAPGPAVRDRWALLGRAVTTFVAAMVIHYVQFQLVVAVRGAEANSRAEIATDVIGKLTWYLQEVLTRSLWPFGFEAHTGRALAVAGLCAVGLVLLTDGWHRLVALVAAAGALVGAYGPNLVIVDQWPAARTRLGLDLTVAVLVGLAGAGYLRALRRVIGERTTTERTLAVLGVGATVALAGWAAWQISVYVVRPLSVEYALIEQAVARLDADPDVAVTVIRADWRDSIAPGVFADEFGLPLSGQPWSARDVVRIELGRRTRELPPIELVARDDRDAALGRDPVIDFPGLLAALRDPAPSS
jgi:hypothetical protein